MIISQYSMPVQLIQAWMNLWQRLHHSLFHKILQFLPTGQDIRMAFTFYREPNLFPVREKQVDVNRSIVGSPVIEATVGGLPNGTELDPLVQVMLVLTHEPTPVEDENIYN